MVKKDITEKSIKCLEVRDKDYMVGLGNTLWLMIRKTGRKTFIIKRKDAVITLGDFPIITLKAAREQVFLQKSIGKFNTSSAISFPYPEVPEPIKWKIIPIPDVSGIYFIWSDRNVILYVGKSLQLGTRLNGHNIYNSKIHKLSIIRLPDVNELNFHECYYIGLLRPPYNFNRYHGDRNSRLEQLELEI